MAEYKNIGEYFSLFGPTAAAGGSGSTNRQQIILFVGVLAGAVSRVVYGVLADHAPIAWQPFVVALIVSVVCFPALYYSGGLSKKRLNFVHWAFAFQNGFFWTVTFDALAKKAMGT